MQDPQGLGLILVNLRPLPLALAARAPYFHNGIATTLEDVVRHYENHFGFVFTEELPQGTWHAHSLPFQESSDKPALPTFQGSLESFPMLSAADSQAPGKSLQSHQPEKRPVSPLLLQLRQHRDK